MPSVKFLTVQDCADRVAREILRTLGLRKPTEEELEAIVAPIVLEFEELRDAIERAAVRNLANQLLSRGQELLGIGAPGERLGWLARRLRRFRIRRVEDAQGRELLRIASTWREAVGAPPSPDDD